MRLFLARSLLLLPFLGAANPSRAGCYVLETKMLLIESMRVCAAFLGVLKSPQYRATRSAVISVMDSSGGIYSTAATNGPLPSWAVELAPAASYRDVMTALRRAERVDNVFFVMAMIAPIAPLAAGAALTNALFADSPTASVMMLNASLVVSILVAAANVLLLKVALASIAVAAVTACNADGRPLTASIPRF